MNIENGVAEGESIKLTCHSKAAEIQSQKWFFQVFIQKVRYIFDFLDYLIKNLYRSISTFALR